MKIKINQRKLMEHLNYVIRGISNKNIIPILNCIKFELEEDGLYLSSTDNEIAIKTFIDKKDIESIDECGQIVVSGKYIYDIVRKLPNELINIECVMNEKIFITTSNSSFNLNCNRVEDFPNLELNDNKNPIIINQHVFKTIINQTVFATSTQESRPVLTGINIKINKNILECTATDSYRLAKKIIEINNDNNEELDIIIPTRNVNELIKLLDNDDENMELHIFNNKVIFKFNTIIMMSKIINGTYPDTSKLIPNEFKYTMKVKYDELFSAIDRASLLTNEIEKNTIKLESENDKIILTSNIPEIGNVKEVVNLLNNLDENLKIAFSSRYMMDALKAINSDEIELLFNGEVKPIIIKNIEDNSLIQLILPIRTY